MTKSSSKWLLKVPFPAAESRMYALSFEMCSANTTIPNMTNTMTHTLPEMVLAYTSPYPTVEAVMKVKYTEVKNVHANGSYVVPAGSPIFSTTKMMQENK